MVQKAQAQILQRLKRIEGQTRGVQKMVLENRDCADILQQLNAINEAVRSVSRLIIEQYAAECLQRADKRNSRATVAEMLDLLTRAPR
jgi:DNA-binding FrmR family transcriptional regulator